MVACLAGGKTLRHDLSDQRGIYSHVACQPRSEMDALDMPISTVRSPHSFRPIIPNLKGRPAHVPLMTSQPQLPLPSADAQRDALADR